MATYNFIVTINGTSSPGTTTTQNVIVGDIINVTLRTVVVDGTWTQVSASGCTPGATSGVDTDTISLTNFTGSSYQVIWRNAASTRWANIQGTVTAANDSTPNAFSFTDQTNVPTSSVRTSNTLTVSGINVAAAISVTGGTYNINGGAYTSTAGTITNGQTFSVRHTSSASVNTAVNTTLTIGGVSDTFTSTTAPPTASEISSVTVGTDAAANATVTVNNDGTGLNFTSVEYAAGTTNPPTNWQASNVFSLARSSTATYYAQIRVNTGADVSNVSSFSVPFLAPDSSLLTLTLDTAAVSSLTINNAATSVTVDWTGQSSLDSYRVWNNTSNAVAVTYAANRSTGSITTLPTTGNTFSYTVEARKTAVNGGDATLNTACTVSGAPYNGAAATFTITRTADVTPDAFTFTDVTNATPSTVYTTYVQITGIEAAVSVSRTSGTALFSVSSTTTPGTFGSTATTISNGQYLHLQITSSATQNGALSTLMNVGGVTDTWTVTTIGPPAAPTNITVTTDATNTQTATVTVAVTGSIGTTYYQINSGTWQLSNSFSGLTRGQLYTFGVKNNNGSFDSTTYSETYTPTFNVVDTSIAITASSVVNGTLLATDTANKTVSYTNASVGSSYYLMKDGVDVGVTTVATGNTGNTWTLTYPGELPSNGTTSTYTVEAICTVANGGQGGSRVAVTGTNLPFTIARATADTTPEGYTALAGNVTSATISTYYYATFSATAAGTTSPGSAYTLNDVDTAVTVSVSNGEYSTNGSTWTATSGSVAVGATVYYRGLSSASTGTLVTHSLTIGTVSRSFTTTTIAADTTPEGYTALAGNVSTANTSTYYYATFSATVAGTTSPGTAYTLSDINTAVTATPTNGQYSTNGSTWNSTAGSVSVGATVYFRGLSSATTGTTLTHTLQLGTVSRSFTTTTTSSTNLNIGTVSRTPSGDLTGAYASTVVVNFTGVANHRYKITRTSGTVTDVVTAATLGVSTLTIPSGTSLPSEGTTSTYQIYVRLETAQGGDNVWYPATSGNFAIIRIQQPTVIDTQTFDTSTNSSTISHSIQLKTEGYGGTKQYAISTSPTYNTSLIGTWQSSPTFTLTRTSSYYFWARRSTDAGDADGSSLQTVPVYSEPNLYGVRVYASNGTTILLDISSRIGRAITKGGPLTVAANSTSASIPVSLGSSDNSHVVVLFPDTDSTSPFTVNTNYVGNSFTITNTSSTSISNIYYYVLNSGEVI